ncbi:MAG: ABC transporter substrate-binding protein [Verrucomicrobia bacterium]|nr:ABC transporter substrate-binding protein [Verrucomicrobiota bacterium]
MKPPTMTFRFLLSRLVFAVLVATTPALAAADDPAAILKTEIDEVLAVAYSSQNPDAIADRVRPMLEKDFSAELVTRQAIGPGWRQFSPSDQAKVVDLFSRLMLRIYSNRVVGTQRPRSITYGAPQTLAADRVEIPSRVVPQNGGQPFSVNYRLIKLSGAWRIYDVLIEGVSFVANYRAQFDELVQKGGAPAVIQSIQSKLASPAIPRS